MSSADAARKHVLCTGIAVLDLVFRVGSFPRPDVKTQASEFRTINGGNAANAAVAITHLGGAGTWIAVLLRVKPSPLTPEVTLPPGHDADDDTPAPTDRPTTEHAAV